MYSFSIRQFIWEYIGVFFGKFLLCNRFQLGNSFGNTYVFFFFGGGGSSLMYSFSIRQFIWEYIDDFTFFFESSLMYSFSIRQFIWEYIGDFYDSWMFGPNFILMLLMFGGGGGGFINTMLTLMCITCMYICSTLSITWLRRFAMLRNPNSLGALKWRAECGLPGLVTWPVHVE